MSEYQCYEFVAFDRQLTPKEMSSLKKAHARRRGFFEAFKRRVPEP